MSSRGPLVSIIMPAYNAEKYILESIDSVIAQTYKSWELIVVDDGSVDSTSVVVRNFKDRRVKLIEQINSGVSKARNSGIENAKGEYITFLDSDDLWEKYKLEVQVSYMLNNPSVILSYTDYVSFINDGERVKNKQLYPFKIKSLKDRILVFNFIATLTVMVKSKILKDVGGFDIDLFGPEDWDLWIKISKMGGIGHIEKKLSLYREHEGGISKNKKRQLEEEYKILLRHVLAQDNEKLRKYALWFHNLKLSSYYFSKQKIKSFIGSYIAMIRVLPFKVENITYPLKRLFKL